ncbi:GTP cyclohydrolase II-domain-containing protein [Hysterangium stoloniferum]|nr:GTP cyclohydrolase II-domain-containing protein [Hysterangium stoloniferum]
MMPIHQCSKLHPHTQSWRPAGPHVTRHHYHHDFDIDPPPKYVSKQAPRSQRLLGGEGKAMRFRPQYPPRAHTPTPYGPAFLHLYRNNRDDKQHLAIVPDASESETDRIVRGVYVGRLTPSVHTASNEPAPAHTTAEKPGIHASPSPAAASATIPAPLVRIHSECFTGETIGSMRCDCGEQLDEALRLISLPLPAANPDARIPGRDVIVYMRQEGRGIGLLSKLRAYNLQDIGHDTVTANLMLGHGADERGYEVAAAILELGDPDGVRLLTNNPAKVRALESEGVRVHLVVSELGVTLIAAAAAHGDDLDKYLRTKVDNMLTIPN